MGDHAKSEKKKTKKSKNVEEVTGGFLAAFTRVSNAEEKEVKTKKSKKDKKKGGKEVVRAKGESPVSNQPHEKKIKEKNEHVKGKHKTGKKQKEKSASQKDVLKGDPIEQHREYYEAETETLPDSIEQHRAAYECAQVQRLHDWYEQESLLGDLESLRRKPWYQKIKEEEDYSPARKAWRSNQGKTSSNPFDQGWGEQNEQEDPANDYEDDEEEILDMEEKTTEGGEFEGDEERPSSQESSSGRLDEVYEDAFGLQDGIRLDFSSYVLPLPGCEKDRDRLNYARRSVERMKRVEELRKSRKEYKAKMEAKRQRRKQRYGRIQNGELIPHGWQPNMMKGTVPVSRSAPLLVDLTNICEDNYRNESYRYGCGDQSGSHFVSVNIPQEKFSFHQQEIPIIVDLSNCHKPRQILDLTNMEEPPSPLVLPCTKTTPLEANRRLLDLRRQQEEKLRDMTRKYERVINKKVHTKEKRDTALSTYQKLMDRVTQNVRKSVCV